MKRRSFIHQSSFALLAFGMSNAMASCLRTSKENGSSFEIKQFEDEGLSHFSYAILVDRKIVLVDPARDPRPYYDYAESHEAKIVGVIETHPHADFISSHLQIHQEKQAKIYVSKLVKATYPHEAFDEGDTIVLSDTVKLMALNTPGHSPDSISVVLREQDQDKVVFTGDALLFGSVGRPDLREYSQEVATQRQQLAQQMYHTIHRKYALLDDSVLVYPTHGAGSLCGHAIRDVKVSTIGYERVHNFAFQIRDEQEFVDKLLQDQPYIPRYFPYNVEINKKGVGALEQSIKAIPIFVAGHSDFSSAVLVDSRESQPFRKSHLPQSINIPDNKKFETWLGTIIPPEDSFYLIVGTDEEKEERLVKAAKIGYERLVKGVIIYGEHQGETSRDFDQEWFDANQGKYVILDVRTDKEASEDSIFDDAIHIPLSELKEKIGTLPTDKAIFVHCASGYRSSIGSSLIKKYSSDIEVYDIGSDIKKYRSPNNHHHK